MSATMTEVRQHASHTTIRLYESKESESSRFDSDVEPEDADTESLTWRIPPEVSMSDWCIRINYIAAASGEMSTAEYHVHKNMLVVGKRRSEYFASLFRNDFSEQLERTSTLEFPEMAAKAFPALLDYLYSSDDTLQINTQSATALYHLARYFGICRLRWKAKRFWSQDMNLHFTTCGVYLEHANILKEEKVLAAALDTCKKHVMDMDTSSRLVHVDCPTVWFELLNATPKGIEGSFHISHLIAVLLENTDMDCESFQRLTEPQALPHIHPDAAISLLDAERKYVKPSYTEQTCLQKRCIRSLASNWDFVSLKNVDRIKRQHPSVLGEIIVKVIEAAKAKKELFKEELSHFKRVPDAASVYPASETEPPGHDQMPALLKTDSHGLMTNQYNVRKVRRSYPLFYYQYDASG